MGQLGRYVGLPVSYRCTSGEEVTVELFLCALYKAYLVNPEARQIFAA